MIRTATAALCAALLGIAGCSTTTSGTAEAPTGPVSSPDQNSQMSPSRTPSTSSTPSSPPTPTTAADGRNLAACSDGVCEVRLTGKATIRFTARLGISSVDIVSVRGNAVSLAVALAGSRFNMECTGDDRCETTVIGGPTPFAYVTGHPGARLRANRLIVEVLAAERGSAIIRMSRR